MPTILLRYTIVLFALSCAGLADAQVGDWYVAPSMVFTNDDGARNLDDALSGGQISIGRDVTKHLSVEGLLGSSSMSGYCVPGDCWPDQDHLDISANLLAFYDRERVVAPYLLLGLGYLGVDADEGPQYSGDAGQDNNPTASVGLGLKWRLGQSNYSIRAEHRWRTAFGDQNLTDQLTSLGVQYDFGGFNTGFGPPASSTDNGARHWYVAPSMVFTNDDGARNIDDSLSGGQIRIGRDLTKHMSVEGLLGYSSSAGYCVPGDCWPDQDHLDFSANLLAYYDRERVVAPYLLLGLGYLGVDAAEGPQYSGDAGQDNNPTASVGLGLKWRLGQSNYSIRAEHRWRTAFGDQNLTDQLTSLGVQYDFGGFKTGMGVPASSTGGARQWYVAPSVVFTNDDGSRNLDDAVSGGQISIGRDLTKHLSVEGLLGYSPLSAYCEPGNCWADQDHLDISANLLAFYDRDRTFAPYLLLGVGYLGVDAAEGPQLFGYTGQDNNPTASVGLGLKWRLGQSNFSIRAEHRLRTAFEDEKLTDQLTSIGVQYNFGGSRQEIVLPDSNIDTDGDGVPDFRDPCPNTRPGVEVDAFGCEKKTGDRSKDDDRVFDNDKDRDRVFDNIDECPNTPPNVPVDARGCSLDSDMDGVTTDKDFCPASRAGAVVDEFGCEADADQDGVVDQRDRCPGTPRGTRVDINGCGV